MIEPLGPVVVDKASGLVEHDSTLEVAVAALFTVVVEKLDEVIEELNKKDKK